MVSGDENCCFASQRFERDLASPLLNNDFFTAKVRRDARRGRARRARRPARRGARLRGALRRRAAALRGPLGAGRPRAGERGALSFFLTFILTFG